MEVCPVKGVLKKREVSKHQEIFSLVGGGAGPQPASSPLVFAQSFVLWVGQAVPQSAAKCVICGVFFPPGYVALQDSKTPHRPAGERVSWCLETSPPSRLPPQDGSLSLTLFSFFLSFIFCPTSFRREWAAFLGAWCPLPAFRSCFVEFAQCSNDLLMNLRGRKWSPCPTPSSSSINPFKILKDRK